MHRDSASSGNRHGTKSLLPRHERRSFDGPRQLPAKRMVLPWLDGPVGFKGNVSRILPPRQGLLALPAVLGALGVPPHHNMCDDTVHGGRLSGDGPSESVESAR